MNTAEGYSGYFNVQLLEPWMVQAEEKMEQLFAQRELKFPLRLPPGTPESAVGTVLLERRDMLASARGKIHEYAVATQGPKSEFAIITGIASLLGEEFDEIQIDILEYAAEHPGENIGSWKDRSPRASGFLKKKLSMVLSSDFPDIYDYLQKNTGMRDALAMVRDRLIDTSDELELKTISLELERKNMKSFDAGYAFILLSMCQWYSDPHRLPKVEYAVLEPNGRPFFRFSHVNELALLDVLSTVWKYGHHLYEHVAVAEPKLFIGFGGPPMGSEGISQTPGEAGTDDNIIAIVNYYKSNGTIKHVFEDGLHRPVPKNMLALQLLLYNAHEHGHKRYIPEASHIAEMLPDLEFLYSVPLFLLDHGGEDRDTLLADFFGLTLAEYVDQSEEASREYRVSSYRVITLLEKSGILAIAEDGSYTIDASVDTVLTLVWLVSELHASILMEDKKTDVGPVLDILKAERPSKHFVWLLSNIHGIPRAEVYENFVRLGDVPER